jgi:hypothetical protein
MKIRCDKCDKIVAVLLPGSTVAKGSIMICTHCQEPKTTKSTNVDDQTLFNLMKELGITK